MDFAQLSTITDAEILRGLVVEKLNEIAARDALITRAERSLAARDALIAIRDESIRNRDIQIEALTHEIARLRRLQFAAKSEAMDPEQRARARAPGMQTD